MRYRTLAVASLMFATSGALAQESSSIRFELRPFVGAFLPRGNMSTDFKADTMIGGQTALELSTNAHVVGTVGWTHGHAKFAPASDDVASIWQYDVGAEFNLLYRMENDWMWRPFAGLGAGGRTYDYSVATFESKTCTAGYAALGSELQGGAVAYRVEGRGYLSCFTSPLTGARETRNDFGLAFGVAWHVW